MKRVLGSWFVRLQSLSSGYVEITWTEHLDNYSELHGVVAATMACGISGTALLAVLGIAAGSASVSAASSADSHFWVSAKRGSDSNSGSQEQPFGTVQHCVNELVRSICMHAVRSVCVPLDESRMCAFNTHFPIPASIDVVKCSNSTCLMVMPPPLLACGRGSLSVGGLAPSNQASIESQ